MIETREAERATPSRFERPAREASVRRATVALEDKVVIINREIVPGRITVVLVDEAIGF